MLKSVHIAGRVSLGVALAVLAASLLAISVSPSGISSTNTGSPRSGLAPDTAAAPENSSEPAGTAPKNVVPPGFFNRATGEVILPTAVKQLVVIGDLHGDLKAAVLSLKLLGVIAVSKTEKFTLKSSPERSHPAWKYIGGPTMMVFLTGDYMDRGPHGADIIEMLLDLAAQAQKVGTNVHLLMGNHEYWQFSDTNNYNHFDELNGFLPKLREGSSGPEWEPRKQLKQFTEDMNEYKYFKKGIEKRARKLFRSKSGVLSDDQVLARMISNMPLLIKVEGILISHAGVTAELAKVNPFMKTGNIAAYVQWMKRKYWPDVIKGIRIPDFYDENTSVIYNRVLKKRSEAEAAKAVLKKSYGIDLQLVGHSVLKGYEPALVGDHVIFNDLARSLWMSADRDRNMLAVGGLVVDISKRKQPIVYAKTETTKAQPNGMRQIWPELPNVPKKFVQ